jgi:ABC-type glycerol-3-phosphate transport system permease component
MRHCFETIVPVLAEAAGIDGASLGHIFLRI